MEITLPISSLILIAIDSVGVVVSISIGLILLSQREKKHVSVNFLSALLILSGLTLLNDLLVMSGISNRIQSLYFIPIYYSLSIGPLFFLLVKSKYTLSLKKLDYLHLILPCIQAMVYFFIGFRSVEFKSNLWEKTSFPIYLTIESFLFPITLAGYALLSYSVLKRKTVGNYFWSGDLKKWLKKFALGILVIAGMELVFSLLDHTTLVTEFNLFPSVLIHSFILSAFVFWVAHNGLKQYFPLQVYTSKPSKEIPLVNNNELKKLVKNLRQLMERDKVFLNTDLNLKLLASYLDVSEKVCSYVLNKGVESNFNNFLNQYRVEAFKEKIQKGAYKAYTLTSIAYECGFESKSTFNRAFKLASGLTPSEFIKSYENSQSI